MSNHTRSHTHSHTYSASPSIPPSHSQSPFQLFARRPTTPNPTNLTRMGKNNSHKSAPSQSTATSDASKPVGAPNQSPATHPPPPATKTRPPPPPPNPHLNGPNDYWALLPLTIISILTLIVLYYCSPGHQQWFPPVDHTSHFSSFEYPGRGLIGGGLPFATPSGGVGSGAPTYARLMGYGGITPGSRVHWPIVGRRKAVTQLRSTLALHPLAIVAGREGVGKSATIGEYIDTTKAKSIITSNPSKSKSSDSTSQEYNVILWLDASSHTAMIRQFIELHAYLRLHTMKYDELSIRSDIHAWLYSQDRWLLIFDNCAIPKEELLRYAPSRGGHSIVVIATDASHDRTPVYAQLGFDLSAQDVIHLHPLAPKMSAKLVGTISGARQADHAPARMEIGEKFQGMPGPMTVAGLTLKRWAIFVRPSELCEMMRVQYADHGRTPFQAMLFGVILPRLSARMNDVGSSPSFLARFLLTVIDIIGDTDRSVSKELLASVLRHDSTALDQTRVDHLLEVVLRELAQIGVVAEHDQIGYDANIVSSSSSSSFQHTRRLTTLYFPKWLLRELRMVESSLFTFGSIPSPILTPSSIGSLVELVHSPHILASLIGVLGSPSRSSYAIPVASVVSEHPQYIAPILRPYELYLSAFAAIAESESSPVRDIGAGTLANILNRYFGVHVSQRDTATPHDQEGSAVIRAVRLLASENVEVIIERLAEKYSKQTNATPQDQQLIRDLESILILRGCFLLDILHDSNRALRVFERTLSLVQFSSSSSSTSPLAPPVSALESKNGLASHPIMARHKILTSPIVPTERLASVLTLISITLASSQEGGTGSATSTNLEVRLILDLALNYQLLANEVRRLVYAPSASSKSATSSVILHPSIASGHSQLGHIYSLQRDLDSAKRAYEQAREQEQAMGFRLIDDEFGAILRDGAQTTNGAMLPSYSARTPFVSSAPRTAWELLIRQLRYIRDLTMLAHEESVLFYYQNAIDLHTRAYALEVSLYSANSLGAASRWLHLGHVSAANQQPKEAHEYYESALQYHKNALMDHADLRLLQSHYYSGLSHNANGRGRAGRKALELSLDTKIHAIGGETHVAIVPQLEAVADTCYALSQYQDALGFYRRLLTLHQTLFGDSDSTTQLYKNRVLNVYQVIQQANEEQKRNQQMLQQQQLKKIQQQRQKEEDERQAKLKHEKETRNKKEL